MNYADEFYTDETINGYSRINVFVSPNSVSYHGGSISFPDLGSFVVSKGEDGCTWTPKFSCKQKKDDDKEVDMLFPLLIGGVELFCSRSFNSIVYIEGYIEYLKDKILDSMNSMLMDLSYEKFLDFKLPTSGDHDPQRIFKYYRSKFTPHQAFADEILQLLSVLNIIDKQAFYEEFLSLVDMASAFLMDFTNESGVFLNGAVYQPVATGALFGRNIIDNMTNDAKVMSDAVGCFISTSNLYIRNYIKDHGAVHAVFKDMDVHLMKRNGERTLEDKSYTLNELTITDCTSFCIGLFAMFAYHLCNVSAHKTNRISNDIKEDDLNRYMNECLGKDMLAKYLRRGFESTLGENQYNVSECGDAVLGDLGFCESSDASKVFGYQRTITRHELEMTALVKAYFNNTREVELSLSDAYRHISGSYYGTHFINGVNKMANSLLEIVDRNYCAQLAEENEQLEQELRNVKQKKAPEIKTTEVSKDEDLRKIAELSAELERKNAQLDKLKEDNEALSQMLADLREYEEKELVSDELDNLSTEEIIEYLNSFSIFFVGGRWDMKERLNEMGLVNIYQANKVSAEGGIPLSCDYLCNMTSFMSHTLYFKYKSSGIASPDDTCNFKGTNIDKLLRYLYSFVKSREMEKENQYDK